jgi:hypothetical protein
VEAVDSRGGRRSQNFSIQVTSGSTTTLQTLSVDSPEDVPADVAAALRCDVNDDGAVTSDDVALILAGRGTDNPLFDIDGDGEVSVADARKCVLKMN